MQKIKRTLYFILILITAVFSVPSKYVYAVLDDALLDKFSANNIMFYDPTDCKPGSSGGAIHLNVNDLPQRAIEIFEAEGVEELAKKNLAAYQKGAAAAGIPWQVVAALHFREASMRSDLSIANGQPLGVGLSIDGQPIGDTLEEDAVIAATSFVSNGKAVYGGDVSTDFNIDNLANAFLAYNRGSMYKAAGEPYTKSPYVMNYIDEEHAGMRFIHADSWFGNKHYNNLEGKVDGHPGALAVFIYLGGSMEGGGSSGLVGAYSGDGSDVTWIGDSISAMSDAEIKAKLPNADIYSKGSKHFWMDASDSAGGQSGITILRQLSEQNKVRDILVFALGTNDPNAVTMENIQTVLDLAKNAKQIIFMTNHTLDANYDKNNENFKAAAANDSRVKVADWEAAVKGKETQYLTAGDNYVHPKDQAARELFVQTIIDAMNGDSKSVDECCEPMNGTNGNELLFQSEKYDMSDGQLKGILAVIKNENGGTLGAVKFEASIMANLFEKNRPTKSHTPENLVEYIRTPTQQYGGDGWFSTFADYDENYSGYSNAEFEAVKDVFNNGRRTIPPEVVEHDDIGDIHHIELDGQTVDKMDIKNWVKGKTKVIQDLNHDGAADSGEGYIFYEWANPEGTVISSSSDPPGTGDPFGYFASNPPKGDGIAGGSVEACCASSSIGGVTKKTIDGTEYAFPIAGATQANYLNVSTFGAGETVLSRLPCGDYSPGTCHHDYHAVDMGIMMEMVTGHDPTAQDYGGESGFSNMYYNSAGATVVAVTAGTIRYVKEYTPRVPPEWHSKCAQIGLEGDDGTYYWMGHLDLASAKVTAGQHVNAGDELIKIGAPQCAQSTQSHLHIDTKNGTLGAGKDTSWIVRLMDELWEALPSSDNGVSGSASASSCGDGMLGDLPAGGMNEEQAKALMEKYKELVFEYKGKTHFEMTNRKGETVSWDNNCAPKSGDRDPGVLKNCVSFTRWFVNTYSTLDFKGRVGDGGAIVDNLKARGIPTGTEPKPYAIFSWKNGGFGHTGIVLGVNDDGTFIVGESGCSATWDSDWVSRAHTYKLSDYAWEFAYIDEYLQ